MLNKNRIRINLELLSNDTSRDIFTQHIAMLKKGIYASYFSHIDGNLDPYQYPNVRLLSNEKIISINPLLGGALQQLMSLSNNTAEIHCFEENPIQYMEMCRNIVRWKFEQNIKPICAAVGARTGMMAIEHNGGSGHYTTGSLYNISNENRLNISQSCFAYRLDDYCFSNQFAPSLIECLRPNMAENILIGAKDIISKVKPTLIFIDTPDSVIPSLMKELNQKYNIFYGECMRRDFGIFYAISEDEN